MLFAVAAVAFALLKYFDFAFAQTSWWWVLVPVALAVVWWEVIDPLFAVSKKRELRKMDARKHDRHVQLQKNLGIVNTKGGKRRSGRPPT
ncbi:MAG: TIGR04438 family Trp-rich protein [Betaproteobacteria bacterium]|nr:TIGR04438 family Trp-rich protein [Betaproteobacteria bacterium]MDE2047612.1 TIGR04438 family Trp-rich protein [Betaproteobacteria bacterium]